MATERDAPRPAVRAAAILALSAIFAASGFAALLYQVAWQRSLFSLFGVNVEAVTIVVTGFMLGLGAGSLAGGALSRSPGRPVLLWFAALEAAVGVFGLVSLRLFRAVGDATLDAPPFVAAAASFLLVVAPTTLMGATLPLLVVHVVRRSQNVGRAVGLLYFVNTLGSALAAFASVERFLPRLGVRGTVSLAAIIDFAVALLVVALHLGERRAG